MAFGGFYGNINFNDNVKKPGPVTIMSNGRYVGETVIAIEERFPGRVVAVNRDMFKPDGSNLTDADIELDNIIIQVKSGSGKKLTDQIKRTATGTKKTVIGYVPDLNPSSALVKGVKAKGFEIFTKPEELMEYLIYNR